MNDPLTEDERTLATARIATLDEFGKAGLDPEQLRVYALSKTQRIRFTEPAHAHLFWEYLKRVGATDFGWIDDHALAMGNDEFRRLFVSMESMNKLPVNMSWVQEVDAVTNEAAERLKAMVIIIATQPNGKTAMTLAGVPTGDDKTSRDMQEMASDVPRMLVTMAGIAAGMSNVDEFLNKKKH